MVRGAAVSDRSGDGAVCEAGADAAATSRKGGGGDFASEGPGQVAAARADKQARYRHRVAAVHELAQDRLFNLQGNRLDNVGRQERRVKQRENGHEDRTSSAADWRR